MLFGARSRVDTIIFVRSQQTPTSCPFCPNAVQFSALNMKMKMVTSKSCVCVFVFLCASLFFFLSSLSAQFGAVWARDTSHLLRDRLQCTLTCWRWVSVHSRRSYSRIQTTIRTLHIAHCTHTIIVIVIVVKCNLHITRFGILRNFRSLFFHSVCALATLKFVHSSSLDR